MEMGEAAPCLMRSVSQPFFASCEYKEGDPLRALTTSISFGRFMTEPLDWERWSTFSHNRTLEDVQKYSRPGVVAEKKAFFEAHYKKIAAKKAAKSPKKENKAPNYSPQTNATTLSRSNSHSAVDDIRANEPPTLATNIVLSHTDEYMPSGSQVEQEKPSIKNVSSPSTNQNFSQFDNVDDNVPTSSQVEQEKASIENDVSSPSTNQVFSQFDNVDDNVPSSSQVEQEKASIENVSSHSTNQVFTQFDNVDDNVPSSSQVEQEKASIENVSSVNDQFQVEISIQSSRVDKNKKTRMKEAASNIERYKISRQTKPEISSSKSSSKIGEYELQSPRKAPSPPICPKKAARDATEKKRSAPQSLHMSMNFPPARKHIGMYSSPFANKNGTSKTTISKPKDRLMQQALTRVSVNGLRKSSQVLPRPEVRRSKPLLDCFVNGRRTVDKKSLSTNHSEASSACTKKPRSSTVPSSFSFRSEERAAKRKEFFQKLEEKSNIKEMGIIQLQPKPKEKARNDNKKLHCAPALEAKPSTRETKAPSNRMQKVPPTRPCSPKHGRKPSPRLVQDTCYQSPWRSSSKPKNFIEINKKKLSSSMASLPTKKMHDSTLMLKT